jgi:DnaD/phage-associated family protein
MALCSFSDTYHIFDVTPVENLFIQEFMLKAPGDFVKVYIYGLNQCYHHKGSESSIENFSRALGLEISTVENALRYWERQGILNISEGEDNHLSIEYYNIKDVLYNKNLNNENALYHYRDFNQNLQAVFNNRMLTPQEYLRIYDWIEVLHLPMEVVLMMVQFYVSKKGTKISINYLDKVAESWAKEGINTLQKAEEYMEQYESCYQDTIAVLKYLGIHRSPSKAELELYKKWKERWGFSLNAVLQACKETTKIQSPNMGYVDKILEKFYRLGVSTTEQIRQYRESQEDINNAVKEVLFYIGQKDMAPTPEHQALYIKWNQTWKLGHSVILLACKQCVRKKSGNSIEKVDMLLKQWTAHGFHTLEDIKAHLKRKKNMDNEIRAVLDRAGDSRDITSSDRKAYIRWTEEWNLSFELILLAAEYSSMAENKLPFINKILSSWYQNGITSIQEAKADHKRHKQALQLGVQAGSLKKQVDFNQFEQHSYSDEDLEYLFEDIENG